VLCEPSKFMNIYTVLFVNFYPRGASDAPVLAVVVCLSVYVSVCLSVCLCVCVSHASIVSKRLNVESRKRHAIAQGL